MTETGNAAQKEFDLSHTKKNMEAWRLSKKRAEEQRSTNAHFPINLQLHHGICLQMELIWSCLGGGCWNAKDENW